MSKVGSIDLVGGTGRKIIIGVDFDGVRSGAKLEDLAKVFHDEATFYNCGIVNYLKDNAEISLDGLISQWLFELGGRASEVVVIIGFCSGGHIAARLADELQAAVGSAMPLIAYDTTRIGAEVLVSEFEGNIEKLRNYLDPVEIISGAEQGIADSRAVAESLLTRYSELLRRAAPKMGIGDRIATQIVDSFSSYLSYLLVAIDAQNGGGHTSRTDVFSSEYSRYRDREGIISASSHNDLLVSGESVGLIGALIEKSTARSESP
ncbi:hypothetical protein [Nocardia asiatica]|uniref:hypothetical protein n=1 Tax=Nocardia asiatica TaxID=209252 RepID=UPI00245736C7|nr:hypothetical protein [Nocardia asiatica]